MSRPSSNPLDSHKSVPTTNDYKVPRLPALVELVQAHGLMSGLAMWDQQMEEWRVKHERQVNQRLQPKTST
jgi:hypothetical protein